MEMPPVLPRTGKPKVKATRPRRRLLSRLRNRCFISISRGGGRWWPARVPGGRVAACARVEYSHPGNNEVGATGTNEELNSILMLQI